MRRLFLLACLIFVMQTAAAQPAGNEPKAAIADNTLSVDGITPGADVLFYGVGLEATGYMSRLVRGSVVQADSDHDGKVAYKPEKGIPFRSIWVVADLRNAHYAVVTPPG